MLVADWYYRQGIFTFSSAVTAGEREAKSLAQLRRDFSVNAMRNSNWTNRPAEAWSVHWQSRLGQWFDSTAVRDPNQPSPE
jgi:hypothetical protein